MNTGLQDAHNIAWKLAMVISGKADKSLLSTYQSGYELISFCSFNSSFSPFFIFFSLSVFLLKSFRQTHFRFLSLLKSLGILYLSHF